MYLSFGGDRAVHRKRASPADYYGYRQRQSQQVEFVTFALLIAVPLNNGPVSDVHQKNGNDHIHRYTKCRDSGQQAKYQSEPSKKFRADRQHRERRRNVQHRREKIHRSRKPKAAKPSEQLLRAVQKEDHTQNEPHKCQSIIIHGSQQLFHLSLQLRPAYRRNLGPAANSLPLSTR
jgi:hypothetical protein